MNQFDTQMTSLADAIKVKNENAAAKLSIQAMIEAVNGITIGGDGDSSVTYGYWTADGKFQEVDLSGDTPLDSGEPIAVDAVMFKTGQPEPEYPGSGGGTDITFYECASYTPDADAYTKYTFTLSGAPDELANGTYVREKWVEDVPDTEDYVTIAKWINENGYSFIEEYGYGEFSYNIKNKDNTYIYSQESPHLERVTDYNSIVWVDGDTFEGVTLNFSAWQTEDVPATTEGWTGYKVTQNAETGVWVTSDVLTTGLTVTHLKPKVGEIFSADTTIRIDRMYDGTVYPIPSDGLVFYAPLQSDYVDAVSGKGAVVTAGSFTSHKGLSCLELDGSAYVKWANSSDLPEGDSPYSFVVLIAPTDDYDWKCYMSMGQVGGAEICIHAKNGWLEELGTAKVTADGAWQCVALTRDENGVAKTYYNGRQDGTGSRPNAVPDPACVCVGAQIIDFDQKFTGYIAFASVYNRELTAEEIAEIHNTLMEDVEQ